MAVLNVSQHNRTEAQTCANFTLSPTAQSYTKSFKTPGTPLFS